MSYYRRHIFFCTNVRDEGASRPSCGRCGSAAMREYAKRRVKELDLAGPDGVRVNSAGCMDRCEEGPVAVVYPEGTWYTYVDESDVEEIVVSHLRDGVPVDRLKL